VAVAQAFSLCFLFVGQAILSPASSSTITTASKCRSDPPVRAGEPYPKRLMTPLGCRSNSAVPFKVTIWDLKARTAPRTVGPASRPDIESRGQGANHDGPKYR
jgi:hypothetical protein